MRNSIDNSQDILDSRDIIERIEELQGEREALQDELDEAIECVKYHHDGELDEQGEYPEHIAYRSCRDALADWDGADELATLEALASEGEASPDWSYGETLVRESYFVEYIEQLIDDCYEVPKSTEWPYRHMTLDYEAAAQEARQDYLEVDFDGVTYLVRA